jgi:hypothetical protein
MRVKEIEEAISQLSPEELAQFTEWFAEFRAAAWDEQLEADARAGKLDELVREAREDFAQGRSKPL